MSTAVTAAWILAAVLLSAVSPADAQDTIPAADLLRQRHVRVTTRRAESVLLRGHVTAIDTSGLELKWLPVEPVRIDRTVISKMEVLRGESRGAAGLRGALAGAAIGVSTLLVMSAEDEMGALGALVLGLPAGALAGGVYGAWRANPQWQEVVVREWLTGSP